MLVTRAPSHLALRVGRARWCCLGTTSPYLIFNKTSSLPACQTPPERSPKSAGRRTFVVFSLVKRIHFNRKSQVASKGNRHSSEILSIVKSERTRASVAGGRLSANCPRRCSLQHWHDVPRFYFARWAGYSRRGRIPSSSKLPSKAVISRARSNHTNWSLDPPSMRMPALKANHLASHQHFRSWLPLYLAKNLIYWVYLFLA